MGGREPYASLGKEIDIQCSAIQRVPMVATTDITQYLVSSETRSSTSQGQMSSPPASMPLSPLLPTSAFGETVHDILILDEQLDCRLRAIFNLGTGDICCNVEWGGNWNSTGLTSWKERIKVNEG